jgi:N utilization substance protein A
MLTDMNHPSTTDLLTPTAHKLVTATVREASPDIALCSLEDGSTAKIAVTDFYPNRPWRVGGRYQLALLENSGSPRLSATVDELIPMLLEGLSPEIRDGRVRVMGVARQVGVRSKVAVAATEPGIDPVGAALGRAANRIKTLSRLLNGERVDVVAYHPEKPRFLANALAVVPESVEETADGYLVRVPRHQLAAARGGGNLNVVLASRLVECRIEVL